jgi:WD40 repeat protein/serine/threonine protein kinase
MPTTVEREWLEVFTESEVAELMKEADASGADARYLPTAADLAAQAAADREQEQADRDYRELARLALATEAGACRCGADKAPCLGVPGGAVAGHRAVGGVTFADRGPTWRRDQNADLGMISDERRDQATTAFWSLPSCVSAWVPTAPETTCRAAALVHLSVTASAFSTPRSGLPRGNPQEQRHAQRQFRPQPAVRHPGLADGLHRPDALVAAMNAWVLDKTQPLGDVLVHRRALGEDERAALDALVEKHLARHGGNPQKSLAALHPSTPVREPLQRIPDVDVQASLLHVAPTPDCAGDAQATGVYTPAPRGERFLILRPHARGGLGQVQVALDQELHREVALKEIRDEHARDPDKRGRFVREAEITGGLEHPGIVPVYGLGARADGRPFYAMRFIQGETLRAAIARYHRQDGAKEPGGSRELELRGLLTRFVAVCNAVAYAHSRGVIHRDLKPANVMLGKFSETLVVDWGLAKAGVRPEAALASSGNGEALPEPTLTPLLGEGIETQAGSALGTPAYMSPEQATGRLDLLGQASDIYSLGATLYTLLTGRPPVEGKDTADILRKAQRGEWLPPRRVKAEVPAALEAVCRKAMALRPAQRYATALELAGEMDRWLADEPVSAYAEPWRMRSRRWLRRHRTLVSTALAALVVALVGATTGLVLVNDARDHEAVARKTAQEKEEDARAQKDEADRQREGARLSHYVAQMNLVQREYDANHIDHVRELLDALVPPEARLKDYRGFEWYYWQRMVHRELLVLKADARHVGGIAFSPDGRRLAAGRQDGMVRIWDVATGWELPALKGTGPIEAVAYTSDGRRLAAADCGTARVWDAATGHELGAHKRPMRPPAWFQLGNSVTFSRDGQQVAFAGSDGSVHVWDAASGRERLALRGHASGVRGVVFSPDARRLATCSDVGTVTIWDAASGRVLITFNAGGAGYYTYPLAFDPDARRLACTTEDRSVRIWDAVTGRELLTMKADMGMVAGAVFSPDGRRLAAGGRDATVRVWDATGGRELFALKGHGHDVLHVVFSPDGRRLASAGIDGSVRVWDAVTGQEPLALPSSAPQGGFWPPLPAVFSPDGRRLARGVGRTLRLWDADTGRQMLSTEHEATIGGLAFSPDGKWLACGEQDGAVRLCEPTTGRVKRTLRGHGQVVCSLAFSPDSLRLASADSTVQVWDTTSGRELLTLKGHTQTILGVVFSPDGKRLASAGWDGTVRIWDGANGRPLFTLQGHTAGADTGRAVVRGLAFSPDGRRLASAGSDSTVRLWDTAGGREQLTLRVGHMGDVQGVAFSPDGRRLAAATYEKWYRGAESTVRIWDTATGQELLTLKCGDALLGVAFSPEGRRLVAWGAGPVKVWEASSVPAETWRRRGIVSDVGSLFEQGLLRSEVVAALENGHTLGEDDRAFVLNVARTHAQDPQPLAMAARKVIRAPGAGNDAYAWALRRAEAAARMAPRDGYMVNTLGIAQYRTGAYAEALATLTRAERLNAIEAGSMPRDLAWLAMAQYQVGKKSEAKATLGHLREAMKDWRRSSPEPEARVFLREAEGLIEGKPSGKGQ